MIEPNADASTAVPGAAYGVRFTGLAPSPTLALYAAEDWYPVEITLTTPRVVNIRVSGDENGVHARYESVEVHVDRPRRKVEISSVEVLDPDSLAHPYLGLPAALFAHWSGKEALHASAAVVAGRAWGLVGNSEQGKSSLAGAVLAAGHPVLVDDLLVTDGVDAFAGPRCIDLRDGVGGRLGLTLPTQRARANTRDRVRLPPVDGRAPLGGFVHLAWAEDGERPTMVKLRVDERLKRLHEARSLSYLGHLSAHGELMLDLAALPAWELRRPRDWANFNEATDLLLATLAKAAAA